MLRVHAGVLVAVIVHHTSLVLAANPLGGAMTNESLKQLQMQVRGGLGLTGGDFTPVPPKFFRDGNTIVYQESPRADEQYNISRQRVFSTIGDTQFYSEGESVFEVARGTNYSHTVASYALEAGTSETPLFLTPRAESVTAATEPATYSLNQDYQDNWAIGNGWLGASLGYHATGSNQGNTFSAAFARGTVLGQTTLLLGANLSTARDYKNSATVSDDTLKYSGNFYLLGQKTELTNGEAPLGTKKKFDELAHYDQSIFKQEWQYFIGPVPILIRARLNGKASTGSPAIEAGAAPGGLNEITYLGYVYPYAGLQAAGEAVIGGFASVPDNLLPAYVKGVVESDFLRGNILSRGYGSSSAKGACLEVGMGDFRTMKTSIWAEAKWDIVQTEFIKTFVNTICDNGYITIPGCGGVQAVLQEVTNVFTFKKRRDIYDHPGFDLGSNRKWLDIKGCQTNLDPTVVELCNQSSEPIHSALMLHDAQNNFWKSVGWYQLPAKGCRKIPMGNYQNGNVYVYSEYRGGEISWQGSDAAMCVNKTDRFDINGADAAGNCAAGNYKMVKTTRINAPANQTTTHTFYAVDFAAFQHSVVKMCNRTHHDNIYTAITFYKNTWTSKGWYKVARDACYEYDLGPYEGDVYLHGNPDTTYGASFGRGWSFCVHSQNAFEYPYITTMGCGANSNVLKNFSLVKVKRGTNVYDFTNDQVLLSKRVCNNSSEKISVAVAWDETYAFPDGRHLIGSQGWSPVEPDKCIDVRYQTSGDSTYIHARGESGKVFPKPDFDGVRKWCADDAGKFELLGDPGNCPAGMVKKDFLKDPGTTYVSFD